MTEFRTVVAAERRGWDLEMGTTELAITMKILHILSSGIRVYVTVKTHQSGH